MWCVCQTIPCFDQDPIISIKFYEYLRPPSMNSTFLPFLILVRNGWMKELKNASRGGKLEAGWKRCNPAPGCRHKLPKFDKISFTQSIQLTLVHSPQRQILDPLTLGLGRWWGRSQPGYRRHTARRGARMEQFPSFSILKHILQNILSFHVWCYRNLSHFPHKPRDSRDSPGPGRAPDPGPGLMSDWNVYPGPAQAQWSFLEITSRDTGYTISGLRLVMAGIMTLLRLPGGISVTMTTLTRLCVISVRGTCGSFHTRNVGQNEAIIGNETGLTLLRWAINIFLYIENMPQS